MKNKPMLKCDYCGEEGRSMFGVWGIRAHSKCYHKMVDYVIRASSKEVLEISKIEKEIKILEDRKKEISQIFKKKLKMFHPVLMKEEDSKEKEE